jgi:hypothetical protein
VHIRRAKSSRPKSWLLAAADAGHGTRKNDSPEDGSESFHHRALDHPKIF